MKNKKMVCEKSFFFYGDSHILTDNRPQLMTLSGGFRLFDILIFQVIHLIFSYRWV